MKKNVLILFLLVASYSFSQSVNDYKAVVIPMKYELQKSENQYRLQTLSKMELQKSGFQAFYANEPIFNEFPDRCSLLYIDVVKDSGFLTTKVYITFKDCYGLVVYKSKVGVSREKEYDTAYAEALNMAFESVYSLSYKYNGNTNFSPKSGIVQQTTAVAVPVLSTTIPKNEPKASENKMAGMLYAQPTSYGYQLIDSEPKVVMKLYKTSNPNSFMAKKGEVQGALVSKDNQWFFEYYQGDNLISEKVEVKF